MPGAASLTYRTPAARAASWGSGTSAESAAIFDAVHVVGPPDDGEGDVADGDTTGSDTLLDPSMGVPVQRQGGPGAINRLGQQVAAQERVDLWPLTLQRLVDRGVMHERHPDIGLEAGDGLLQGGGDLLGMPHERLHFGLSEVAPACPDEAASEPLRSPHAQPAAIHLEHHGLAFEHS